MSALVHWLLAEAPTSARQAQAGRLFRGAALLIGNPLAVVGIVIVATLVMVALLAPWLATHDPLAQDLGQRLLPPSAAHWLGTDQLGRDIYSRVVHGARLTLIIVLLVAAVVGPVGLLVGIVAGYFGGWVERVLMRVTDVFLAFPRLILALALAASLGPGIESVVIAICLTAWAPYARVARAETLTIRSSDYIIAIRLQGAPAIRVLAIHIAPQCVTSMIIRLTLDMAGVILIAAGMGFLGVGAQPPAPEWGAMVATGRDFLIDHWWVATVPGAAIFIVSLGFNFLGDGLRDALDPRHG